MMPGNLCTPEFLAQTDAATQAFYVSSVHQRKLFKDNKSASVMRGAQTFSSW